MELDDPLRQPRQLEGLNSDQGRAHPGPEAIHSAALGQRRPRPGRAPAAGSRACATHRCHASGVRLTDDPLRILGGQGAQQLGTSLIGGVRSRFYVRELHGPTHSVGAMLRPGAAEPLFVACAADLAEKHTALEDLWGVAARCLRERLLETGDAEARLAILEAALAARLPRVSGMHPAIAKVIGAMPGLESVRAAVALSGFSHRRFIEQFRRTVGMTPKAYLRLLRFQCALRCLRQGPMVSLSQLAVAAGYSDQAHFNRDFLEFAGVTPTTYRRLAAAEMNHLPVERDAGRRA